MRSDTEDAAAEIGISDVGLKKVCDRHRVPVPPQGYLSVRTRWSDTTTRKLETMLNDVLAGLIAYAAARKERHAEWERRKREQELRQKREAEARTRAELEKARVEFLERRLKGTRPNPWRPSFGQRSTSLVTTQRPRLGPWPNAWRPREEASASPSTG